MKRQFSACQTPRSIYISILNSFPVIRTASAKNCHFHVPQPTFLFLLETRLRLSRNMLHGWKDNSMLVKPLAACTHLSSTVSQLFEPQVQKIDIITYRSPHFCFPWGRLVGNHAKCCMDGKRIRCLQIVSQHVPICQEKEREGRILLVSPPQSEFLNTPMQQVTYVLRASDLASLMCYKRGLRIRYGTTATFLNFETVKLLLPLSCSVHVVDMTIDCKSLTD